MNTLACHKRQCFSPVEKESGGLSFCWGDMDLLQAVKILA